MDDDKLLRSLGAAAAAQQREGEGSTWERVVASKLSTEELAELERLADTQPETRELLAASRPLDADARGRIANALGDALANRPAPSTSTASTAPRPSSVLRPARWRSRVGLVAGGLALAAGVALFVGRSGEGALPPYFLDSSGIASSRAGAGMAPPASCVLQAGPRGSFELIARPNDAVTEPIAARAFLVRGNDVAPFPSDLEISPKGSVRLFDESRKLTGATELRVVVGRRGELSPTDALVKARTTSPSGRGWQVLRCAVETDASSTP